MNCPIEDRHPEVLVAYAAGELDRENARALERHLADCAACRPVAAGQTAVWKALEAWEAPPVSPDFDRRLYRRIDEGVRLSWWDSLTRLFRTMPLRHALPLTAAAGLLLMAGLLLYRSGPVAPVVSQREAVRANQVENALDDLDLLRQLGTAESAEGGHPDAM
jgi:anti-sigma factor RsiW